MNRLLETAYKKLHELYSATPTWETFERISDLYISIQALEREVKIDIGEISQILNDMRDSFGDTRTLDIISSVLCEFKQDIDTVSPHLANCLINKIREKL